MRALFTFTLLWVALLTDLLAGQIGLPLFFSALALYYVSLTLPVEIGFGVAIALGLAIDLVYGRELPVSAVILAAALLTGRLIRLKRPTHPLETGLAGMGVTLIAILGNNIGQLALTNRPENPGDLFWELIFFGAIGLLMMPLLTAILDGIGKRLGLSPAMEEPKASFAPRRPRRVRDTNQERKP